MNARTVLFGGTFDPVHNAHIQAANAALAAFSFQSVLFVPAANPPHKAKGPHANFESRVRMLELACADHPALEVSRIEQGTTKSYSILTIEKLQSAATGPLAFLIGADAFAEIATWHRWHDVVREVEFIVVSRPGAHYAVPEGAKIYQLNCLSMDVSSSQIRKRIAEGDLDVPIPAAVLSYIQENGLYVEPDPAV